MKSLFIFRRDFRLEDNTGLLRCIQDSSEVFLVFIFTPQQVSKNDYFSSNSFQFLIESLECLGKEIEKYSGKLHYYYGNNVSILEQIKKMYSFEKVYSNQDFTPYALHRDEEMRKYLEKNDQELILVEDYLLAPIGTFCKKDGSPYQKYTPFWKNSWNFSIRNVNHEEPWKKRKNLFVSKNHSSIKLKDMLTYYSFNVQNMVKGGRKYALKIVDHIQSFKNYEEFRNDLTYKTTHLSSYIKYGNVSIREIYHLFSKKFGKKCTLNSQLVWREFYFYIGYYFPRVLNGKSLKEKYDGIKWENNKKYIESWKKGQTGYPVVDAAMRQLNTIGFMHNRGRLITSAVLIKILKCDWRIGEKYFAQQLIDYDPLVNNGNWQWSSGSGADSQPYFRIFNPWTQSKKFDPDCVYIKQWVHELKDVPSKQIHEWYKYCNDHPTVSYPDPINNYEEAREEIKEIYKKGIYDD